MKHVVLAFGFFALSLSTALAGETVENETFGFEVTLPDGWLKTTADQYYENLSKLKTDDPSFQEALTKNASAPIVMAMKHQEPFNDINPSFKINVRPYGGITTRDGVEILNVVLPSLQRAFSEMQVTTPVHKVSVGGKNAAHVAVTYKLKTDAGEWPGASELWLVPEPNYLFMVGIGYRPDEQTGSKSEIISAVKSIKFMKTGE